MARRISVESFNWFVDEIIRNDKGVSAYRHQFLRLISLMVTGDCMFYIGLIEVTIVVNLTLSMQNLLHRRPRLYGSSRLINPTPNLVFNIFCG